MTGQILLPLNTLKVKSPDVFDGHAQKYKGREVLMERVIPTLDCLWNDVIHLSPIHPQIIINTWEEHGLKLEDIEFPVYKIPVHKLNENKTVYFDPHVQQKGNFEFSKVQIRPFAIKDYHEQKTVSDEQIQVWKKDRADGRQMFWYSHTTHILYQGEIDISDVEILICK